MGPLADRGESIRCPAGRDERGDLRVDTSRFSGEAFQKKAKHHI